MSPFGTVCSDPNHIGWNDFHSQLCISDPNVLIKPKSVLHLHIRIIGKNKQLQM